MSMDDKMIPIYIRQIERGLITIEQVPERIRDRVQEELDKK